MAKSVYEMVTERIIEQLEQGPGQGSDQAHTTA